MNTLQKIFNREIEIQGNVISCMYSGKTSGINQQQTIDSFDVKWKKVEKIKNVEILYKTQREWFMSLYGFELEKEFQNFLSGKTYIMDAGCGLGYKAAWMAGLAPESMVIGIDISESLYLAAKNFQNIPNLFFLRGDIAALPFREETFDFVVCDQVIMHTENPEKTFSHLSSLLKKGGEFACYVYRKKALPRELIDDYFRTRTHTVSQKDLWEFSEQLTELGKRLSELRVSFESPDIPLLGIKGGTYDVQRFIYWNFLKCFWREEWGFELSKATNYDWYAPSNAKRFSKEEFLEMIHSNNLKISFLHEEEACYSGRFCK